MAKPRVIVPKKTLRDLIDLLGEDQNTAGDIRLAGFLLEHGFANRDTSVGLIGAAPDREVLGLNALISPHATLVGLGLTTLIDQHAYLTNLVAQCQGIGLELRLQLADLTLSGRWPAILVAMARTDIGILGVDARWAATEENFWSGLQTFMQTRQSLIYIRNILDFRHPEFCLPFIRTMPPDCTLDVVATTPGSVWFAADAARGAAIRELLRSSGLFAPRTITDAGFLDDTPCVVENASVSQIINQNGRFPAVIRIAQSSTTDGLNYAGGWSTVESDGCWTAAEEAVIRLELPARLAAPRSVAITGNSWMPPNVATQVVCLGIGKEPKDWIEVDFADPEEILTTTIDLKAPTYDDPSTLTINVRVRSPGRPSDYGGSDTRMLGFKFRSVAVFT